jgi:hypothetical protein
MSATSNKQAALRDKRAQGIAAMGLVRREGDRFRVTTPSLRGRRASYEVWRDEANRVRCSCLEFEEQSAADPSFRCEHILAVKHSLLAKNTEAGTSQQPPAAGAAAAETLETPGKNEDASEKRAAKKIAAEAGSGETARFEREQTEAESPEQAQPPARITPLSSLAKGTNDKEHDMKRQIQETANAVEPETERAQLANAETHQAPVVPLAFANTLRMLRQPIDPKLIKTREGWTDSQGQTHMVEYVEWHTVADLLDRITPTWSHAVRQVVQIGDMVAVTAAITIDGVTREGVGTGTAYNETGIKKAEHDALKRAAIKFGIARDLYQRETEVIEKQGAAPQTGEFPRDPLAKSMADLVTPKQLGMIRALGREAGVDVEEECQSVLRCRTEELSKRAASSFIDHLKNLQQQQEPAASVRRAS